MNDSNGVIAAKEYPRFKVEHFLNTVMSLHPLSDQVIARLSLRFGTTQEELKILITLNGGTIKSETN